MWGVNHGYKQGAWPMGLRHEREHNSFINQYK